MPKVTEHLPVVFTAKEIKSGLDALALDDWVVVSCFPVNANNAELGIEARIFCLLRREVNV